MKFEKYRRINIAEMRPVTALEIKNIGVINNLKGVSISDNDLKNGSPKNGDMIARNPKNHNDTWLVSKEYFKNNFELIIDLDRI